MRKLGKSAFVARAVFIDQTLSAVITDVVDLPGIAILGCLTPRDLVWSADNRTTIRGLRELGKWGAFQNTELFGAATFANLYSGAVGIARRHCRQQ